MALKITRPVRNGQPLLASCRGALFLGVFSCAVLALVSGSVLSQVAVLTQHNDNSRTGANSHETLLAPSSVNKSNFGRLFSYKLDDQTYSQPLYVPSLTMSVDGQAH